MIGILKEFFHDLIASKHIINNLVNQDLTVKYKRSTLGFFWSVLNPLLNMLICSLVFGSVMRFDLKDFVVFLYAGMLPWSFFSQATEVCSSSILRSEGFIKKIYIPKIVFPFSSLMSVFINVLFQFIALFIVILILGAKITPTLLFLPISFLILFILVVGTSLLTSAACVYFRDVPYLINVLLGAWYYLTPILYPIDRIPDGLRIIFECNPMYYFVQLFRCPIYEHVLPPMTVILTTTVIAFVVCFFGMIVFYRHQDDFVYRL